MFYLTVDCRKCGGNLTDMYGRIAFMSVSDSHNSLDCYWTVYGHNETVIQLDIIYIDINFHWDCSNDYLEVCICTLSMQDFSM